MADATPSRLGQIEAAGAVDALFLKMFSGEVLTAFEEANVMYALHHIRQITAGKSAQFPATWKADAEYHTAGAEITGDAISHDERIINVDGILLSNVFIAEVDEAVNHYDVRGPYSEALGRALSKQLDKNLLQLGVLAARASATFAAGNGGSTLTNAGYDTTPDTLVQGLFDAAQALDEKDVPEQDRYCVVKPKQYNMLVQSEKAINRDWNDGGSNGSIKTGKVLEIAGVKILKSNHLPQSNISQMTGTNNTYHADFSNVVGLVFQRMALGTVKLRDLKMEHAYDIRRQGTLFVAKYLMGHGILRPECAVELKKA